MGEPEELTKLKGQFLASLNHEIRTPLSGILGMIDLVMETTLDEEQREYVGAARLCAENLLEILNATLEYSALTAGSQGIDESEIHLHEAIRACVEQQRSKADSKGLSIFSSTDMTVPTLVLGDAMRIRQLLAPLLDNAIKFTHRGGVELRVFGETTDLSTSSVTFEIRDTGIGIPADHLNLIFDSFRQVESGLSRSYPGLGLGMAIAQKVAHLLNGKITVESQPGRGTTVRACIPLKILARPDTGMDLVGAAHPDAGRRRILVVEDNGVAQQVVGHMLRKRAYAVDCVSGGQDAIDAVRAQHYDLILMDLQMPGMDGIEASAAIRKLNGYGQIPILAFTANSSDEYRYLCREYGMQAFVGKPVQAEELYAALDRFLA
ncbi:MAG: ATP-binding protein [Acidobacteria bacterium]|nr:ATP-binding protein [Acidobacteriota bacterium]